ncbi:MAG: hypothetical protein PHD04_04160 [Candidatus Pacebacteria bacterium]|nr:hypothetical protein [Candidatus Paceibacterota bacterium]
MNSAIVVADTAATAAQYNNLRKDLVLDGGDFATSGGAANVQTLALDAQIVTAYATGMLVKFKAGYTNTAACSININTIGANTIKQMNGSDLEPGMIVAGATVVLIYDGTNFQLVNPAASGNGDFGDGSDGAIAFDGSTAHAGFSSLVGTVYTLTRDVFGTTITLTGTGTIIDTAGYRVYASVGIVRASGNGKFRNNGGSAGDGQDGQSGGSGTGGTAGTAGAAAPGVTVPSGIAGKAGIAGTGSEGNASNGGDDGTVGTAGDAATTPHSASGSAGGAGGDSSAYSSFAGGAGGAGGANTKREVKTAIRAETLIVHSGASTVTFIRPAPGAGSGGTGAWSIGATSQQYATGGSGGSGASGGFILIVARHITDSGTATMFEAIGGDGGDGGDGWCSNGTAAGIAGSGGGAGGSGGTVLRLYKSLVGTATVAVTGGSKGVKGVKAGSGTCSDGSDGTDGTTGVSQDIIL